MSPTPRPAAPFAARWVMVGGVLVLALLLVTGIVRGAQALFGPDEEAALPAAQPSTGGRASAGASGSPSAGASQTASPSGSASPSTVAGGAAAPSGLYTGSTGLVHSGIRGEGTFTTAALDITPSQPGTRLVRYTVRVEDGLPLDAATAAREVQQVLDDPRGWTGVSDAHFELVSDPAKAEFTLTIASPPTVDRLCPLPTIGIWSCDSGSHVLVNYDRWAYRTPIYSDDHLYRAYMVNHEVGHFLGHGHLQCPGAGRPAPVMMQQSKSLGGCVANAWPTTA